MSRVAGGWGLSLSRQQAVLMKQNEMMGIISQCTADSSTLCIFINCSKVVHLQC